MLLAASVNLACTGTTTLVEKDVARHTHDSFILLLLLPPTPLPPPLMVVPTAAAYAVPTSPIDTSGGSRTSVGGVDRGTTNALKTLRGVVVAEKDDDQDVLEHAVEPSSADVAMSMHLTDECSAIFKTNGAEPGV